MKTVHIISHSHWDREWYLPYERHHMLLVELIDDVLELFENDPEFKSFYLDGQTIILDDYLQVRPDKKEVLQKYIDNGQLKIGPFYILQDAYLTSSESNVRNMLIGQQESAKWGANTKVGYYPDTFGNAGQTPQLMKQLGFDLAAFGRGVKPTGFANESTEEDNFVSSYSEMNWEGADGSEITGLLFANWYSNGNEVPVDREEAKKFWEKKLQEAEAYASTDHLLFMNGCDHQPVQKDLSEAIRVANELYDDYHFIHSDFTTYMEELHQALPEKLDTVKGELTSQETEGWYTLTNTASSRVYLKQENAKLSRLLENMAEPLAVMAAEQSGKYPHDILDYAWKTYMQNHPHDSICGCSIDEVHDEMETRFMKAEHVAKHVIDEALQALTEAIDTEAEVSVDESAVPFVIFNTTGVDKEGVVTTEIEKDAIYFNELFPTQSYEKLEAEGKIAYSVVDSKGEKIQASVKEVSPRFNYDLPKDKFRQPYVSRKLVVELHVDEMTPFSWRTYYLVPEVLNETKEHTIEQTDKHLNTIENQSLQVTVEKDGSVTLKNKLSGETYPDALIFEDTGDIGNEYVYKQPEGEKAITSLGTLKAVETVKHSSFKETLVLTHVLDVPVSADELLYEEQNKIIEFRERRSQRTEQTEPLEIKTILTLEKNSEFVKINTQLINQMKDHRLRVRFKTGIMSSVHYADSMFETVERPNKVSEVWTNPENPQRLHHYVNVCNNGEGMIVSPDGLNEYEVIEEDGQLTIALTLFRSVGELGDWGYFPTPGAQMLNRKLSFDYAVGFHGQEDRYAKLKAALNLFVPFIAKQTTLHNGSLPVSNQFFAIKGDKVAVTALKKSRESDGLVSRLYNLSPESTVYNAELADYTPYQSSILETEGEREDKFTAEPFEIITHLWKKED